MSAPWVRQQRAGRTPGHQRGRTQFADGFLDEAARGRLREGVSPESAAALFPAVLNGLQLQWVLDQDLDIIGPLNDFVRLLLDQSDRDDRDDREDREDQ
ncbi:hypothetical protein QF034_007569 [Streptomyces africanus]|uniref:Tetracyclin repressor-like C-terminal domain-containing protein n=1 Tax=Streptomyces africanus TaxID=231024 RepID=A0ABU0R115_9ACTN|nr:hypothetical protein [Streptomyces africanus]MDQ0753338.1 hypothetical protein [Streptomyces africanus]